MRKIIQILLFLISYAPLYIILMIQNIDDTWRDMEGNFIGCKQLMANNTVSIALFLLTFLSISVYFLLYRIVLKSSAERISIRTKKDNSEEHLSYLVTYILPFVGLDFTTWQAVAASLLLFYVLGAIYIRTDLILTNPTLIFFGFSISKIETGTETGVLIHKRAATLGDTCDCIHLIKNIYILKP